MNVYTSYYWAYQNNKLPISIFPVSISRTQPEDLNLPRLDVLIPSWKTLNNYKNSNKGKQAEEAYTLDYNAQLSKLNPHALWEQLELMSNGNDVALLCFEGKEKFCHRQLVASWFFKAGYPVQEYTNERQKIVELNPDMEQISFFDVFTEKAKNINKNNTEKTNKVIDISMYR